MGEPRSAAPALYGVVDGDRPPLHGRRCDACGYTFFPPQDLGCESCGAGPDRLEAVELEGSGSVVASTTVFLSFGTDSPPVMATVALDAGPTIDAICTDACTSDDLAPGTRVRSCLVASKGSSDLLELRFEPDVQVAFGPDADGGAR